MRITSRMASRTVGTARRTSGPFFFLVFGAILAAIGIFLLLGMNSTQDYLPVNARITDITVDDEVYVEYVVNGQKYTEKTNSYSSSYRVGQELELKYNPDDPSEIVDNMTFLPYIMTGVGLIIVVSAITQFVTNIKKKKAYNQLGEEGAADDRYLSTIRVKDILPGFRPDFSEAEENEYYFRFSGKQNQGHLMETPDRQAVYEAKLVKFSLLGESEYEFEDYINGSIRTHLIGKTTTIGTHSAAAYSYFKLDGENALDILRSSGYTVDTQIDVIPGKAEYTIYYMGQSVGRLKVAGSAIMPNVKSNALTENLITKGLFKVYCKEENIPIMFLYALVFSRTEMMVYE